MQLFHKIPSVFNGYVLFKNIMNYTRDTVLLSLLKLDPENTMKVLRMVGGLKTSGRLVSRPMPPEDAPEDSNLPRRLAGRKKFTPVSLHMQRPVILLRGSTVGAFDGETLVGPLTIGREAR